MLKVYRRCPDGDDAAAPIGRRIGALAALAAACLAAGCRNAEPPIDTRALVADASAAAKPAAAIAFDDVTATLGVTFNHVSGNSGEKHFPSANGSGVAMTDYDGDGRIDLYFLTARLMPFDAGSPGPQNRLFRNRGDAFEEVSLVAGLDLSLFCHGVSDGDLDNDGFVDLIVTTYGGSRVLRNNGDGTYQNWPEFQDDRWGSSAAACDYDNDGALDFYVTHYGIWSIETNLYCGDQEKQLRTFCSPKRVPPAVHALYKNLGDGRFQDVTDSAGVGRSDGRGQGVVASDVNLDGAIDLYVANDLSPNFLFVNNADGTFRDVTDFSGAAFSREGIAQAGMGVDCADFDRDGLPDLFVTNFNMEYNALYRNLGSDTFVDKSHAAGVAGDSMSEVGWGTRLVDLDNDGWVDVLVVNGHVDDNITLLSPQQSYAQPPKVWRNVHGRFQYLADGTGSYFEGRHVARGAAFGDLDNDGRLDVAVNHVDSPAAVLRNVSPQDPAAPACWIRLVLRGTRSNRDAIGTCVKVTVDGRPAPILQQRNGGASYLSAHDPRLLIGLGSAAATEIRIQWPSREVTVLHAVSPGSELVLTEPGSPSQSAAVASQE